MASAALIFCLNAFNFSEGCCSVSSLKGAMPSMPKISICASGGAISTAARKIALLKEPFLRLPAIPRIEILSVIICLLYLSCASRSRLAHASIPCRQTDACCSLLLRIERFRILDSLCIHKQTWAEAAADEIKSILYLSQGLTVFSLHL
jgi:hypothetical protein